MWTLSGPHPMRARQAAGLQEKALLHNRADSEIGLSTSGCERPWTSHPYGFVHGHFIIAVLGCNYAPQIVRADGFGRRGRLTADDPQDSVDSRHGAGSQ